MCKIRYIIEKLKEDDGIGVVEVILILVGKYTPLYRVRIKCIESKYVYKLD